MTAAGLTQGLAVVIHQQWIRWITEFAAQQQAELSLAKPVAVDGPGAGGFEHVLPGPEAIAAVTRRRRGRHRQAVEQHYHSGHAAVGQVGLGIEEVGRS